MTICGKNVDTLRPCKRSNRDFFWLRSTENTYILSSPVFLYTRTNLVSKTPILKVLARVSFYWQPMTICGKNVDTLRPCKRSNRDFFWLWSTENTHILSSPVFLYITRGVLRCLLGFLALWGQKPCGGNYCRGRKTKRKSRSPFKPTLFSVHSPFLTPLTAEGLALRTMICWTSRQVRFWLKRKRNQPKSPKEASSLLWNSL